jgi:hypothetical protein
MEAFAASRCSKRMRSTVALNSGELCPACGVYNGVNARADVGEGERGDEELRVRGDGTSEGRPNIPLVSGVIVPDREGVLAAGRCLASEAALSSRLVVPSAFVDPDRAEQTMATLC